MADALPGAPAPSHWGDPCSPSSLKHQPAIGPFEAVSTPEAADGADQGAAPLHSPVDPAWEAAFLVQDDADRWAALGALAAAAMGSGTTTPAPAPAAEPTPHQLLALLDGWLANTGHAADHPWRTSIARTLGEYPDPGAMTPRTRALAVLLHGIARQARCIQNLAHWTDDGDDGRDAEFTDSILMHAGVVGWLAERGLRDHCNHAATELRDTESWLLPGLAGDGSHGQGGAA